MPRSTVPDPPHSAVSPAAAEGESRILRFVEAVLDDDALAGALALQERHRFGAQAELDLLAEAARRLGDAWIEDRLCFASVTLGMSGLQRLLWACARREGAEVPTFRCERRLLLAAVPGEQHGFGLNLLWEELRRKGLPAVLLPSPTASELEAAVRSGGFGLVGLSISTHALLGRVAPLTKALRRASPVPLHLMAGGGAASLLDTEPDQGGVDEILVGASLPRLAELLAEPQRATSAA